ncbi:PH domain-containing protein [Amycolatopsis suaedae]|uniref:YdbS-like PH domain-containing protein n=1 Tax=Amycolatopsis suaedae TaxID=2510978 RepID=A0A4Q7J547_9PSEU|nr:PH domain-containing protein [Amycolatopsis suaedae]RZQ61154.1 hypothetical protein EWH70_25065 [Amycolatopsis suaedae]
MTESPGTEQAAETPQPPIDAELLRIRSPRHRLDPKFIVWRTLNTLFWGIGTLGVLLFPYFMWESTNRWLGPIIWVIAGIYVVNLLFMPTYRYFVHRWETSDEAVYSLTGWITREWRIVPISRIQSIDTVKGPVQQLLGLATVKVTTASGEGGITIEGLSVAVAEETVRHLNEITQVTPGDAT